MSVFGTDERDKVRDEFRFPANNLVITSIDIQSVEPVDQRTRDALQKSVQLAIEITTNSQEATARCVECVSHSMHYAVKHFIYSTYIHVCTYTYMNMHAHCPSSYSDPHVFMVCSDSPRGVEELCTPHAEASSPQFARCS